MSLDEPARLHLYEQARQVFDEAAADTLMSALPRDPDRFATKDDLAVLSAELRAEMADLRAEIKATAGDTIRTMVFANIATNATLVGLVFAAVKLA